MRPRIAIAAAALAFVSSACGAGTTQPNATGNSTPSPKPSKSLVRVVGTDDAGSTVEVKVDESLRVELSSDYGPPTARPAGIVERTSVDGGYPTGRPMVAVFRATAPGTADIESTTDYACLHATPRCMLPQQLWSIHVVVRVSPR
jgi:hypothetical protein